MKWLAVLAFCYVAPVAAQQSEAPNFRTMSDAELLERATTVIGTGFYNACDHEMPLFSELARRNPTHTGYESGALLAEAFCVGEQGRLEEALRLVKQSESVLPVPIQNNFGLDLAIRLSDGPEALSRLRKIAAAGRIKYLDADFLFAGIRTVSAAGLEDEFENLAYELTASNEYPQLDPTVQGALATRGLGYAVNANDLSRLDELLEHIRDPEPYIYMLADRTYESAWPRIEKHAGDHLEKVTSSFVSSTARDLADDPDDRDRLTQYAYALLYAGRDEEAAVLARDWLARTEDDALQEGEAWALEVQARALDALGRTEEADAVFDRLVASRPDQPWTVNFLINRAIRLLRQDRWSEALDAFDLARPMANEQGTDYARLLVAHGRVCALHRLGRGGEAESEIDHLIENVAASVPVAASGLLCADRKAEAERLIEQELEREDGALTFMDAIQGNRFDLTSFRSTSNSPERPGVRDVILGREDFRTKVLERVRLLPDYLVPLGNLRRLERRAQ